MLSSFTKSFFIRGVHAAPATAHQVRQLWQTALRCGANTTLASMISGSGPVPTVDHMISLERATEILSDKHLDAVTVTKDSKVVGIFTKKDYYTRRSKADPRKVPVAEVATMLPRLVVASPQDTVKECIDAMNNHNINTVPVVEASGHVVGTLSMSDLAKEYMADEEEALQEESLSSAEEGAFSEPFDFPENIHELKMEDANADHEWQLYLQSQVGKNDDLGVFSEPSDFPEVSPVHEAVDSQLHVEKNAIRQQQPGFQFTEASDFPEDFLKASEDAEKEVRFSEPAEFPEDINYFNLRAATAPSVKPIEFSEPSDFPEEMMQTAPVDFQKEDESLFTEPSIFPEDSIQQENRQQM